VISHSIPREKVLQYPLDRRLDVLQDQFGRCGEEKKPSPCWEPKGCACYISIYNDIMPWELIIVAIIRD
jgi:hypothetical protein